MNVAQRGTSSTSVGYVTIDRFNTDYGGENEAMTFTRKQMFLVNCTIQRVLEKHLRFKMVIKQVVLVLVIMYS